MCEILSPNTYLSTVAHIAEWVAADSTVCSWNPPKDPIEFALISQSDKWQ